MGLIERKRLNFLERWNIPQLLRGLRLTLSWVLRKPVTLSYPESRPSIPDGYKGFPTLVKDMHGREKCVACQLCEFVCPAKAIKVRAAPIQEEMFAHVEREAASFELDATRCIHCGMCEEVCPEEAIVLQKNYSFSMESKSDMQLEKEELYRIGGTLVDEHFKWEKKR